MTTITAPLKTITLQALVPDLVRSCIVQQPSPPPDPGEEPPSPVTGPGIYTPVAPGVIYDNLPVVSIVDTSPDQMIGCIIDTADNPQGRLNALFPSAVDGDGVIERSTNDIWVFDGTTWDNVGPTPGPTIVTATVIPPWNEIVTYNAIVRSRVEVTSLPYALALLTEPAAYGVSIGVTVNRVMPRAAIALAASAPTISTGASVDAPLASVATAAQSPSVSTGASVAVPAVGIALLGFAPESAGPPRLLINIPAQVLSVTSYAPAVSTGASVSVPVVDMVFAAPVPIIPERDPDFASVSLLLHMDGTNGSTTFTDSSSNGLTVTANGNAQISTAQSKFNGASGLFDGNGDYLLATDADLAFGTGDFTVEGWMYVTNGSGYRAIASFQSSSDSNALYVLNSTLVWYDGSNRAQSASFTLNTWHHFAATRASGTVRVFLNGVKSSTDWVASANITSGSVRVGTKGVANGEWFAGYIDDLRVTKGVARYTANFTPPTAAFPDM